MARCSNFSQWRSSVGSERGVEMDRKMRLKSRCVGSMGVHICGALGSWSWMFISVKTVVRWWMVRCERHEVCLDNLPWGMNQPMSRGNEVEAGPMMEGRVEFCV